MTLPTPDQIRARQTAYLATEAWWKTRVEALRDKWRESEQFWQSKASQDINDPDAAYASGRMGGFQCCAVELEDLLAERPSR